jgi:hypothetical protein
MVIAFPDSTPLCPAGHLPLKGGDRIADRVSPVTGAGEVAVLSELLISPREGEMSGRTEGGVTVSDANAGERHYV